MSQFPPPLPSPLPSRVPPAPPVQSGVPLRPQTQLPLMGLVGEAWGLMTANYGLLVGIVATWLGITIAGSLITGVVAAVVPLLGRLLDLATNVFLAPPLMAGALVMGLRIARGDAPSFDRMFDGFRNYWPVVWANFLKGLIIGVCVVVPAVLIVALGYVSSGTTPRSGPPPAWSIAVAVLVAIPVYVYLWARLSLIDVLLLDETGPGPRATESVAVSWRLTGPIVVPLILLSLLQGLIGLGSVLLLLVGLLLLGMPLVLCMSGVAAKRIIESLDRPVCQHCGYPKAEGRTRCTECGQEPWHYTRTLR